MNALDVKKIRENMGLSQEAFGKLLGVSYKTILNWEKGRTIPGTKIEILDRLNGDTTISVKSGAVAVGQGNNTATNNTTNNNYNGGCEERYENVGDFIALLKKKDEQIDRLIATQEGLIKQLLNK